MNDVLALSALRQAKLIRDRHISPEELFRAHVERIAEVNPAINAAIEVFAPSAPSAGPMHGVPFSIKDSIQVAGHCCTAGSLSRRDTPPATDDATLVARLRDAGAAPLARTNLPDMLFAFEADNLLFGRTNNPYDLTRTSGGSSGGEAALIAACASPLGLGSDAAGSVRLPAAFCGIAGIKPTSGRLARTGHVPPPGGWIESLWQIGPMARYVEDLCAVMPILAGADGLDWTASHAPWRDPANVNLSELRIAFYTANGFVDTAPEVAAVVRRAAQSLKATEEARPACIEYAYDLEMKLLATAELTVPGEQHPLLSAWMDKLIPYRTNLAGLAKYWAEWDAYRAEMLQFARHFDVILCPAYTQPALTHGTSILDENFRGFSHTMAYNVAGWPAAVVRSGTSSTGLPIAVQIAAPPFREDRCLAVAARLEAELGGYAPA